MTLSVLDDKVIADGIGKHNIITVDGTVDNGKTNCIFASVIDDGVVAAVDDEEVIVGIAVEDSITRPDESKTV